VLSFSAAFLRGACSAVFAGLGSPAREAALVAAELVEANLMGYDSHGIVRTPEYVDYTRRGRFVPGARLRITRRRRNTAIVDCGLNFGQVGATFMTDLACRKARRGGIAYIVSTRCGHVGRVGAYVQRAAEKGLFAFATCNNQKAGHIVAPWGGREGRLGTNPLAFAAPTDAWPVVLDMSTCMIPGGKLNMLKLAGKPAPPGCIQDANGLPSTDPSVITALSLEPEAPTGTILPFGSEYGYKGYGLSMMVEIMGGIMAGLDMSADNPGSNGFSIIVVDPDAFCGRALFRRLVDGMCAYQMSSAPRPGCTEVVVPGLYDFRTREKRLAEGIPVTEEVWDLVIGAGRDVGVNVPREEKA